MNAILMKLRACTPAALAVVLFIALQSTQAVSQTKIRVMAWEGGYSSTWEIVLQKTKPDILVLGRVHSYGSMRRQTTEGSSYINHVISSIVPFPGGGYLPKIYYNPQKLRLYHSDGFDRNRGDYGTPMRIPYLAKFFLIDSLQSPIDSFNLFVLQQHPPILTKDVQDSSGKWTTVNFQNYWDYDYKGDTVSDGGIRTINRIQKKVPHDTKGIGVLFYSPIERKEYASPDSWYIKYFADSLGVSMSDPHAPWSQNNPDYIACYDATSHIDKMRVVDPLMPCDNTPFTDEVWGGKGLHYRTRLLYHSANIHSKKEWYTVEGNNGDPRLFGREMYYRYNHDEVHNPQTEEEKTYLSWLRCISNWLPVYNDYEFGAPTVGVETSTPSPLSKLQTSPNPSNGVIRLSGPAGSHIRIISMVGFVIETGSIDANGEWTSTQTYLPGAYIVESSLLGKKQYEKAFVVR